MTEETEKPSFFRDKDGKVVLYQHPNIWLILFIVFMLIHIFVDAGIKPYIGAISSLLGLVWAYKEAVHGVNGFRKSLGYIFILYFAVYVAYRIFAMI